MKAVRGLWLLVLALGPAWGGPGRVKPPAPTAARALPPTLPVLLPAPSGLPLTGTPTLRQPAGFTSIQLAPPAELPNGPASVDGPAGAPAEPAASVEPAQASAEKESAQAARRFDGAEVADILQAARPVITNEDAGRTRAVEKLLVAAVEEAAFKATGRKLTAVSRGSTARMTQDKPDSDFDLMVDLAGLPPAQAELLMSKGLEHFSERLEAAVARRVNALYKGRGEVAIGYPRLLTNPVTRRNEDGVVLVPVTVRAGGVSLRADVMLTDRKDYANDYPALFARQLARVRAAGGVEAQERMLSDIRLAKALFRSLGAYKFYQGGPSGVGIEQMVLDAGSFDAMMDRLHDAAVGPDGRLRPLPQARQAWMVKNPYMQPDNFLDLLSPSAWGRLRQATQRYRKAREAGQPITLEHLRSDERRTITAPDAQSPPIRERSDGAPEIVLRLKAPQDVRRHAIKHLLKRLDKNLYPGNRAVARRLENSQELEVRIPHRPQDSLPGQVKRVLRFFHQVLGGFKLLDISVPGEDKPASSAAAASAAAGDSTLRFLETFTLTGPKPSERGDAFLFAQGAKALALGLEESWAAYRRPARRPQRAETVRGLLLRKDGSAFIRVLTTGKDGRTVARHVPVPGELADGIVSEALVEASLAGDGASDVRPIGAYPMDMMIGRVARRGGELVLDTLFRHEGRRIALYPALPLRAGAASPAPKAGDIVQAFVRPGAKGFEAVPLIALGAAITPEIAAREIALRHGARGYFERGVIEQAETVARAYDAGAAFADLRRAATAAGRRAEDLRAKPFITVDPVGAGDLDDAYYTERHADGSWTWYLATADVSQFVKPGTPAFRAAARVGNTFYSIDKEGVPEFPMNHPLVSKHAASLLSGKDSLAMISKMRFGPDGRFLLEESEVFLGVVNVKGRYTYDQVHELWKGAPGHGIGHVEQVELTRTLAGMLHRQDDARGKLDFDLPEVQHRRGPNGWTSAAVTEPALLRESHRLIEELKVYGNRVIGKGLLRISQESKAPHISRVHQAQDESVNERLRRALKDLGAPWKDGTLAQYLKGLRERTDLKPEVKEAAQLQVLVTRRSASYATDDAQGHEGLTLEGGAYDHPSTPIRRFSDMYNQALREAELRGGDPAQTHREIMRDLRALGFADLDQYLEHLNGRAYAARQMDYEVDDFMSVYELARPENAGKSFSGWVRMARGGRNPTAVIALRGSAATLTLSGEAAKAYRLLDEVDVTIRKADLETRTVDADVRKRR